MTMNIPSKCPRCDVEVPTAHRTTELTRADWLTEHYDQRHGGDYGMRALSPENAERVAELRSKLPGTEVRAATGERRGSLWRCDCGYWAIGDSCAQCTGLPSDSRARPTERELDLAGAEGRSMPTGTRGVNMARYEQARARMQAADTMMAIENRRGSQTRSAGGPPSLAEYERQAEAKVRATPAPPQRATTAAADYNDDKKPARRVLPASLPPSSQEEEEFRYSQCRAVLAPRGYELQRIDTGMKTNLNGGIPNAPVVLAALKTYQITKSGATQYTGGITGAEQWTGQLIEAERLAAARNNPVKGKVEISTVPGAIVVSAPYGTELPSPDEIAEQFREQAMRERIKAELREELAAERGEAA